MQPTEDQTNNIQLDSLTGSQRKAEFKCNGYEDRISKDLPLNLFTSSELCIQTGRYARIGKVTEKQVFHL